MVSPHTSCPFYILLTLIATCTDAANICTAARGSSVHLPCFLSTSINETFSVTWTKGGSNEIFCQYRVTGNSVLDNQVCNPRVNIRDQPPQLYLTGVQASDAGYYTCSMERIVPPPALEYFYKLTLHVEGPPHVVIERAKSNQSDCLLLRCTLDGQDSEGVNITWSRQGQRIPDTTGSLHLCKPDWSEGDTFTCHISHSSNHTGLSDSITLTQVVGSKSNPVPLIIICLGALAGSLALIGLVICIYKCKKRADSRDSSTMYNNKVYENFSFSTAGPDSQRTTTLQHEQCIYEN